MEETTLLEVINRIKNLLEQRHWYEAREYTQLEINNITGATAEELRRISSYYTYI